MGKRVRFTKWTCVIGAALQPRVNACTVEEVATRKMSNHVAVFVRAHAQNTAVLFLINSGLTLTSTSLLHCFSLSNILVG
mmetsp:Transcript_71288/g.98716  ORF Transcript_71288/g.98716 Transcript_71288/m.98716 type:complete len:80 (+) Transcript_71288:226-465(+)